MLFAEFTGNDWVLVIGAIVYGLKELYKMRLESRRNEDAKKRDEAAATQVADVKQALTSDNQKKTAHLVAQDQKLEAISDTVHEVKTQTNGLMSKIEDAAFAKGVKSEAESHPTPL